MTEPVHIGDAALYQGDCLAVLASLPDNSVDAIVTDPPYGLAFMGKRWDYDVPDGAIWAECLRVLKPGGHLLAFAGTRTQHRMAIRIEDAGFEIRDMIAWVYGSGFPKSLDVSKAIDKHGGQSVAWFGPWFRNWRKKNGVTQKQVAALFPSNTGGLTGCVANWELGFNMPTPDQFNLIRDTFGLPFASVEEAEREVVGQKNGTHPSNHINASNFAQGAMGRVRLDITAPATPAARQWQGWGTALKPSFEPVTLARKPFPGTVAANVLAHGTGAINVDGCRVDAGDHPGIHKSMSNRLHEGYQRPWRDGGPPQYKDTPAGRFPANLIHDGSAEVVGLFPETTTNSIGNALQKGTIEKKHPQGNAYGEYAAHVYKSDYASTGSAARFFYCAKASKDDRDDGCEGLEERESQSTRWSGEGMPLRQDGTERKMPINRNFHPTVKPTALMRYLCRLITPPGGVVLDPFMGSGSTGLGAWREGFRFIGIEREAEYFTLAIHRLRAAQRQPDLFHEAGKAEAREMEEAA
jgi:DNA modification methylase